MPVWQFNSLQTRLLMFLSMRKRRAEELKTLSLLAASCGLKQEALDCYLQMLDLNNPDRAQEKEDFSEKAMERFKAFKKKALLGK